jgi:hypothetical protein
MGYTITQLAPDGTVTVAPFAMVIGPTLIPLKFVDNV